MLNMNVFVQGDQVRSGYPGYTGDRPKVQIWHGTADTTLSPQTGYYEAVKEWTNVFGYSQTPISQSSMPGFPSTYTNSTYGPKFQAILAQVRLPSISWFANSLTSSLLSFFSV
jgi:acetylxylan esterase